MSEPIKLPWDPAEIARRIVNGDLIFLGDHVSIKRGETNVVHHCRRCNATLTKPFSSTEMSLWMDEAAAFIMKHVHQEAPS